MGTLITGRRVEVSGVVSNVTHFGAFVDIGVGRAGLLHRSQMPPDGQGLVS